VWFEFVLVKVSCCWVGQLAFLWVLVCSFGWRGAVGMGRLMGWVQPYMCCNDEVSILVFWKLHCGLFIALILEITNRIEARNSRLIRVRGTSRIIKNTWNSLSPRKCWATAKSYDLNTLLYRNEFDISSFFGNSNLCNVLTFWIGYSCTLFTSLGGTSPTKQR